MSQVVSSRRDDYVQTLCFGKSVRIPLTPGAGRRSTRERWYQEGLPPGTVGADILAEACRQAGIEPDAQSGWEPGYAIDTRMNPMFEEKVLEVRENSQVVQDWKGNICEIGLEYTTEYLRSAIDFVTRRWIKCPVESRTDWLEMRRRYDPDTPERYPALPTVDLSRRDYPLQMAFSGPYWILREWCGFEGLSMMFYDNPSLVREMIEFWEQFILTIMERTFKVCVPDQVHISEDMAFKGHMMLSKEMCREFLMPTWKRWGDFIRRHGVPIYAVDSDGHVGELIPLWIECGVTCCDPVEVAAGNDIVAYRRQYGRQMAFRGGVDKRAMAKGGKHIDQELARLRPVIESGGFIPGCDHAVPADVSWPNFVYYVKRLAEAIGR